MADWTAPTTSENYTNVLQILRERDENAAKWFDGTTDSDLPDGVIRINSGQGYRLEKWDSGASSWNAITTKLGDLSSRLPNLTNAEVQQLENIDTTTISATQWGYLGEMDQSVRSAASPSFSGLTVGGSSVLTAADEGSGNNLDADTVDGNHASHFATASALSSHENNTNNPHSVSAADVNLGNVLNKELKVVKDGGSAVNATWDFNTSTGDLTVTTS